MSQAAGGGFPNDASFHSGFTADGRFVVFDSYASNLVPQDTNGADVFVRELSTGQVVRVSVSSAGVQGNGHSRVPAMSADGRFVAWRSLASNLVPGDTNQREDVFVHDRFTAATTRVSVSSAGAQANQECTGPALSGDGRLVGFESAASTLVPIDVNGVSDVFLRDVLAQQTIAISVDLGGATGNQASRYASISQDGRYVAFQSMASNLVVGDTNGVADIFVRDLWSGTTQRVSLGDSGQQSLAACLAPSISGDGRFVSFESAAGNLVPNDTNALSDVFVRDLLRGTTVRVSVSSSGLQGDAISGADCCVAFTSSPLSYDGRIIAFLSVASTLVPGDTDVVWDVYVHDLLTRETERVSVGESGQEGAIFCLSPSVSANGRFVTFTTADPTLIAGDNNVASDVFLRDRGPAPHSWFCSGDGSSGACPCGNTGTAGRGCENSRGTGGALLSADGGASLSSDTLVFTCAEGSPNGLALLFQGNASEPAVPFGDGLRCVDGFIRRIQSRVAAGGMIVVPEAGEPSISVRSAASGDPIPIGATRFYQAYYRDGSPVFCPAGGTANASNAVAVLWSP